MNIYRNEGGKTFCIDNIAEDEMACLHRVLSSAPLPEKRVLFGMRQQIDELISTK